MQWGDTRAAGPGLGGRTRHIGVWLDERQSGECESENRLEDEASAVDRDIVRSIPAPTHVTATRTR